MNTLTRGPGALDSVAQAPDAWPRFSAQRLADDFAREHARDLRYVASSKRWFGRYGPDSWAHCRTLHPRRLAVDIGIKADREEEAFSSDLTSRLTSPSMARKILALARLDPRIAARRVQILVREIDE